MTPPFLQQKMTPHYSPTGGKNFHAVIGGEWHFSLLRKYDPRTT